MGIFYPMYARAGLVAQLSLHTTIRGLVTTLFLPLAGWLFSKVNPRVLLTAAGAMLCGSTLSMAFFHHVYQWYLASAFAGVAGAFLFLTATPILLTRWFPRKSGMAIGIAMAFTGLGGAVMSPLGTWWTEQWGWRSAYLLFGTVGAATILPCTLLVLGMPSPDPAVAPQEEGQSPPQEIACCSMHFCGCSCCCADDCLSHRLCVPLFHLRHFGGTDFPGGGNHGIGIHGPAILQARWPLAV